MNDDQVKCPSCGGTGRVIPEKRCVICQGFGLVNEQGLARYRVFKALEKERKEKNLPPPNFNADDCYF